ncbi:MAG: periplasmic heavy metal sensor [Ignavibacteriae bacterium]|nr:periplasmic heavy metal sensor [Ignavibacteriota bacterium]
MKKVLVLLAIVGLFGTAFAQPHGPQMQKIERFKKMRMIEMLDLKEEQSIRFIARYNEFENTRRDLNTQRNEILDKIERLLRNNADSKEFEKLFAEVEAVGRKIGDERLKFFNGLSDLLTVEQRAKLLLFERRFENELREAVREVQQRRRGRMEQN